MNCTLKSRLIPCLLMLVGLIVVSSCNDDDEKPGSNISFALAEQTVNESAGTVDVTVVLDRPLDEPIDLFYKLSGTADVYDPFEGGDYFIPTGNYISIGPGTTQAKITIKLVEDYDFEVSDDFDFENPVEEDMIETIVITLVSVIEGTSKVTGQTEFTLKIKEDDTVIFLLWDPGTGKTANMDMFLWIDDDNDEIFDLYDGSIGNNAQEAVLIPGGLNIPKFGLSAVYKTGDSDNLQFQTLFFNFGGTVNGTSGPVAFDGTYTLANLNDWESETGQLPKIIQTFDKNNLNYTNVSQIHIPDAGSRMKTYLRNFDRSAIKGLGKRAIELK
nr:MAG: hypothetical protein DIU61_08230 [Bacteroidota bacterium]